MQLMECLRAFSKNVAAQELMHDAAPVEWLRLYQLSYIQKMIPITYDAIKGFQTIGNDGSRSAADIASSQSEPTDFMQKWHAEARSQVVLQSYASDRFLSVYGELSAAGISAIALKGVVCRRIYDKPDYRISSDEDIYCVGKDFQMCIAALESMGYRPKAKGEEGVVTLVGADNTVIELHSTLFAKGSRFDALNAYFESAADAIKNALNPSQNKSELCVFQPTDELLYLVAHAAKHFISSGFGVRTVADIAQYASQYAEQIDNRKIWELFEKYSIDKLALNIFATASLYLGFDAESVGITQKQLDKASPHLLLLDCLDGGIYGKGTFERAQSAKYTVAASVGKSNARTAGAAIFPKPSALADEYPYVNKCVLLVPLAWASRISKYILSGRRDAQRGARIGKRRQRLLKLYGIGEA